MASIITGNYGVGHHIMLKDKSHLSNIVLSAIKSKYNPGEKFEIYKKTDELKYILFFNNESQCDKEVYLKDTENNIIKICGSTNGIQNSFNHDSKSGKSNTNFLTELKENISLYLFLNKNVSESKMIEALIKNNKEKDSYKTLYYASALKQDIILQKHVNTKNGYVGERQADKLTNKLYFIARKLSKLTNDNWNPADVWLFKEPAKFTKYINDIDIKTYSLAQLNSYIQEKMNNKEILPISLKQVEDERAEYEIINKDYKVDLNFKLAYVDMDFSFNNYIPWTISNFAPRCGFKSSKTSLNVYIEGRMKGVSYQLGAVDKKAFMLKIKNVYKDGENKINDKLVIKRIAEIMDKVEVRAKGKKRKAEEYINAYEALSTDLAKKRAYNLINNMHAVLIHGPKLYGQEAFFEWLYKYSRKITDKSSPYILIH